MKTRILLLGVCCSLLFGCAGHRQNTPFLSGGKRCKVRIETFVLPSETISLPIGPVLLGPVSVPGNLSSMKGQIEDLVHKALLQTRTYSPLVKADEAPSIAEYQQASLFDYAMDQGIPFIMRVEVQKVVAPSGIAPGFVSMTMAIKRTKDKVTLVSLYGEAKLVPRREKDYIFYTVPYRAAPTVPQAVVQILRAMTDQLRLREE